MNSMHIFSQYTAQWNYLCAENDRKLHIHMQPGIRLGARCSTAGHVSEPKPYEHQLLLPSALCHM